MKPARPFYPLLPVVFFINASLIILLPVVLVLSMRHQLMRLLESIPIWLPTTFFILDLLSVPLCYAYHCHRLWGSSHIPRTPEVTPEVGGEPLLHVVVIVAYREPIEVLRRTVESVAAQVGVGCRPMFVFAGEARDESCQASFAELCQLCGDRVGRTLITKHVLLPGEQAGKASNENWALRQLYQLLVDEDGLDAFRIMVTIADADSILSPTYLANVESHFQRQPDGRRLIYNGPLNTYRNFADGCLLAQFCELQRCHMDTFFNPFVQCHPLSNYSLTLGLIGEIDFWTPDNMPEDIHTGAKAMLNNFGSLTTVPVESIICNDLVESCKDRYIQAKRHQWGITEFAWHLALFRHSSLDFPTWWAVVRIEAARCGSFFDGSKSVAVFVLKVMVACYMGLYWRTMPWRLQIYALAYLFGIFWRWIWFWAAECVFWQTLMRQFPVERPGVVRWAILVIACPLLSLASEVTFSIVPTLHCLAHMVLVGELGYISAPKGKQSLSSASSGDQPLLPRLHGDPGLPLKGKAEASTSWGVL